MCTHGYWIKNKYTGTDLFVKCGKCPACLQEKAAYRVSRIKAQDDKDFDTIMVSLTYRRNDVPYIVREDAYRFAHGDLLKLPIYRNVQYRKVRQSSSYDIGYKKVVGRTVLGYIDFKKQVSFSGCKDLKFRPGEIGVSFYPDVQHFMSRLRINLKRNFDFDDVIKSFSVSEYGGKTFRPHFHLLFWVKKGVFETFRAAVIESWPFSDLQNWPRACEIAFRASSYCASYVNCGFDFPSFFKVYFKPKHSYSKDFGCNFKYYRLDSVLEKFRSGSLSLLVQKTCGSEIRCVESPIPKYVIHRYFPLFKGYSRMSPSSLFSCMQRITRPFVFNEDKRWLGLTFYEYNSDFHPDPVTDEKFLNMISFPVYYNDDEIYKIGVKLCNAYNRFLNFSVNWVSLDDYLRLHIKVWSLYKSTVLRIHLQNCDIPLEEKYDNLSVYKFLHDLYDCPLPVGFTERMLRNTDPNKFVSNIVSSGRYEQSFYDHLKHRCVSNIVISCCNEEF